MIYTNRSLCLGHFPTLAVSLWHELIAALWLCKLELMLMYALYSGHGWDWYIATVNVQGNACCNCFNSPSCDCRLVLHFPLSLNSLSFINQIHSWILSYQVHYNYSIRYLPFLFSWFCRCGLTIQAFNMLPVGCLDGGRAVQVSFFTFSSLDGEKLHCFR